MKIKQISVFLENKAGRLQDVLNILAKSNINIIACSLADTLEFGILRLIVPEPDRTHKILKENKYTANISDVLLVSVNNVPGSLSNVLNILTENNVGIEYLYGFSCGSKSFIVLRPDDIEKSILLLKENNKELLREDELFNL